MDGHQTPLDNTSRFSNGCMKRFNININNLKDNLIEENVWKPEELQQDLCKRRRNARILGACQEKINKTAEKRPSKYSCSLESNDYTSKIIRIIKQGNGT